MYSRTLLFVLIAFAITACQTQVVPEPTALTQPVEKTPDGVHITPYERSEIKRQSIPVNPQ